MKCSLIWIEGDKVMLNHASLHGRCMWSREYVKDDIPLYKSVRGNVAIANLSAKTLFLYHKAGFDTIQYDLPFSLESHVLCAYDTTKRSVAAMDDGKMTVESVKDITDRSEFAEWLETKKGMFVWHCGKLHFYDFVNMETTSRTQYNRMFKYNSGLMQKIQMGWRNEV